MPIEMRWFDSLQINFLQAPEGYLGIHAAKKGYHCSYFEVPLEWKDATDLFERLYEQAQAEWQKPALNGPDHCAVCNIACMPFQFRYRGRLFCRRCGSHFHLVGKKKMVITSDITARHEPAVFAPQPALPWQSLYIVFHNRNSNGVEYMVSVNGWDKQVFRKPLALLHTYGFWDELRSAVEPPAEIGYVCPVCGSCRPSFLRNYRQWFFCGFCGTHLAKSERGVKAMELWKP